MLSSGLLNTARAQGNPAATSWSSPEGPLHANYSPQTQITVNNVAGISPRWVFPIPSAPGLYSGTGAEGVHITPLIIDGIIYFVTNWARLFAISATDGHVIWFQDLPLNTTVLLHFALLANGLPLAGAENPAVGAGPAGHYHEILYTTGIRNQPLIWVPGNDYHVFAYNALTGDLVINVQILNLETQKKFAGNFGSYDQETPSIVFDEKDGILIFGAGTSEAVNAGRGFFQGYDVNSDPPKLLWTQFMIPPQDGSDPNWDINSVASMDYAWMEANGVDAINLKALTATQLHDMLYGDWGNFGFNGTHSSAGAGVGWGGSWEYDDTTGLAYVATGQPAPDFNATTRPGPNLWTDAIWAMNPTTGRIVWATQTTAHDLWDYDCSRGVVTGNVQVSGATHHAVFKGCKNGILYALDASTGQPLWALVPPGTRYSPSVHSPTNGKILLDPTSKTDMTKPDEFYPATTGYQTPGGTGAIESDFAFDQSTNTIFLAGYNDGGKINIFDVGPKTYNGCKLNTPGTYAYSVTCGWGASIGADNYPGGSGLNTTIYGINSNTGKVVWRYDIPTLAFRGGVTASSGVVYVPLIDGTIKLLRESDGSLIASRLVGAPMVTQPAIGADANGNVVIVQPAGTASFFGPNNPGFIMAFNAPSSASTSTTVATTTLLTSTLVTSTIITPVTGIDPSLFYSTAAVAVIFVIVAGFLAVRRRKPAT